MEDLSDDCSASEDADEPVENHESSFDVLDGFRVLANLRCRFQGKVETANVSKATVNRISYQCAMP